jgi:hypothetical protein
MRWMRRHGRLWRCIVGDRQSRAPRQGAGVYELSGKVWDCPSFMEAVHAQSTTCSGSVGRAHSYGGLPLGTLPRGQEGAPAQGTNGGPRGAPPRAGGAGEATPARENSDAAAPSAGPAAMPYPPPGQAVATRRRARGRLRARRRGRLKRGVEPETLRGQRPKPPEAGRAAAEGDRPTVLRARRRPPVVWGVAPDAAGCDGPTRAGATLRAGGLPDGVAEG